MPVIPHYRRPTWLPVNFVTLLESLTPHVQQPGWLSGYMLFATVLKHDFQRLLICPFFLCVYFWFLPSCAAHTHGSCTHSRSCLYMRGSFQTEPVKDIQPVVNMEFEGGVSVFYLSCLFTGAFPASLQAREINDGWRQFEEESTSPLIEIEPGFLLRSIKILWQSQYFKNIAHLQFQKMVARGKND